VHAERPARTDAILTQLAALAGTPEFDRLVQTMQRARRIVPPGTAPHYNPGVLAEPAEIRLHETLGKTRAALDGITDLTHAVTEFFDQVYVMDDNPQRRAARLGLLATITELGEQALAWEHLHT
jgi:glycyl-tRNA synthetase